MGDKAVLERIVLETVQFGTGKEVARPCTSGQEDDNGTVQNSVKPGLSGLTQLPAQD